MHLKVARAPFRNTFIAGKRTGGGRCACTCVAVAVV